MQEAFKQWIITLDGGAASGKSSVSRALAQRLGIPYISTGLFYRALTVVALQNQSNLANETALLALLEGNPFELRLEGEKNQVFWSGANITEQLHTALVDAHVSQVSKHSGVREWVRLSLRQIPKPLLAEGRDMGTAVFPDADIKFFLTASPEVRAARRLGERLGERDGDIQSTLDALLERDQHDAQQSAPAPDARMIDTSDLTLEQVVDTLFTQMIEHTHIQVKS